MAKALLLASTLSFLACSAEPSGSASSGGGSSGSNGAQGSSTGSRGTSTGPATTTGTASGGTTGRASSSGGSTGSSSSGIGSTGSGGLTSSSGGPSGGSTSGGSSGGSACGGCPTGFVCGSANGHPVCRNSQTQVPLFGHVFVVMMENSDSSIISASATPYLSSLAQTWATSSNYSGVTDPSLPNYLAITSGDTQNATCDCYPSGQSSSCQNPGCSNLFGNGCNCGGLSVTHLGDQLDGAGLSWKDYGESMGTACNATDASPYAVRHIPFLYYGDVLSNASYCQAHVIDYAGFSGDLTAGPPTFSLIAPNLNDDMHGTGLFQTSQDIANGDSWLSQQIPTLLGSSAFQDGGLVLIVWDEGSLSLSPNGVPFFLLSPYAKQSGYVSGVAYNHYSVLATVEDGLGLTRLANAASATPLQDFFPAN